MKKYKQIPQIQELQQKLDRTYGKGLYKAGFVLLLFCCLFFTSCASDSRSTSSTRVGTQETTSTTSTTSSEARIKITDPNQKNTPNNLYGSDPAVLDAYFAREDTTSGAYKRIKSAAIGDTVFIVVDTANLSSRTIKVTIKDENKIIKNKIPFLQYKTKDDNTTFEEKPVDVSGEFSSKVRNDAKDKRFALYKIVLKAKEDDTTKKWQEEISKHTDKKLKLYLTVTVEGEEAIYCGSNFANEEERATDKESNVWLNMDKKWFDVSLAMKTYYIHWNKETEGKIEKYVPKNIIKEAEKKYKYVYYDKKGNEHSLGIFKYKKTTTILKGNAIGTGQVELIDDIRQFKGYTSKNGTVKAKFLTWNSDSERWYINPDCLAGLLGAMLDLNIDYLGFNGFSNLEGKSTGGSTSHINGKKGDLRYLSTNKNGERILLEDNTFDCEEQNNFNDALYKFGWARLEDMYSEYFTYKKEKNYLLNHTKHMKKLGEGGYRHHHHLHLTGFDHSIIINK